MPRKRISLNSLLRSSIQMANMAICYEQVAGQGGASPRSGLHFPEEPSNRATSWRLLLRFEGKRQKASFRSNCPTSPGRSGGPGRESYPPSMAAEAGMRPCSGRSSRRQALVRPAICRYMKHIWCSDLHQKG